MSTEHQQYSTENQADKLQDYAEKRGIDIVRTYEDSGKSGLSIDGRASLQKLIADVELGAADFSLVLAYNVNRAYSLPLLSHSIHLTYPPPSAFMPSPQNSEM